MYFEEKQKLLKQYKKTIKKFHINTCKYCFLFGVSNPTRNYIHILQEAGIRVEGVIDNDEKKSGTKCAGVDVLSVDSFKQKYIMGNTKIIIDSPYWREMRTQLISIGVNENDIVSNHERKKIINYKRLFLYRVWFVCKGFRIYSKLLKQYGKDVQIFICPYSGTGDIYLIGTYWKEYLDSTGIDDYVFVVTGKACASVAKLFHIKNIIVLDNDNYCKYLIAYYRTNGEIKNIKVLNDGWRGLGKIPSFWIRGYKGHNFDVMFKKFVFELSDNCEHNHPQIKVDDLRLYHIIEEYKLVEKRSVILSPYTNTLPAIDETFWEKLALVLSNKGYVVYTNIGGKGEKIIEGTKKIFFDFEYANPIVEYAGYFIGVRSGLCDIISNSNACKIILYDRDIYFFNSSIFEYFSLNKMKLCNDAIELNLHFTDDNNDINIRAIIERLENNNAAM